MALTDKDRDELLGRISRKIESSAVLNGGFDKLVSVVDHIKQRQEEQSEKLDQINTRLYEPKDGLFSRVQQLENDVHIADTRLEGHDKTDEDVDDATGLEEGILSESEIEAELDADIADENEAGSAYDDAELVARREEDEQQNQTTI
jgi:hypothetical protein